MCRHRGQSRARHRHTARSGCRCRHARAGGGRERSHAGARVASCAIGLKGDGSGATEADGAGAREAARAMPCEGARAWARPAAERVVLGGGAGRQEVATRAAGARGAGSLECGEQRARSCGRRGRAPQGLHRRAVLSSGVALGTAPVWACSIRRWRIDGHVLVWGGLRRWRVSSRHG